MVAGYTGFDKRLKYLFDNATEVSATALYNSGTLIGTITVDGQTVNIYAPSGGGSTVTYSEGLQSGTLVGTLTIDGVSHNLYCTEVEANPQGQAMGVLNTLGINGTIYEIQGGGGGGNAVFMSDYYSTEERVVGRWINGKPVYQITFDFQRQFTTSNNAWLDTGVDLSGMNIEDILYSEGYNTVSTPNVSESTSKSALEAYRNLTTNHLEILSTRNGADYVSGVTIRYTKTTDAPGTAPTPGNIIYLPTIYSEEEHEVGVWIDGKPLYQKTLHFQESTEQTEKSYTTEIQALGAEYIKLVNGEIKLGSSGNNDWYSQPFWYSTSNNEMMAVSKNLINIYSRGWKWTEAYATVQYTKTTDTPGSGTWTPDGSLAHHYSTSEHIIGTWIDGSTLWEKTIVIGTPVHNAYTSYSHGISNFGKLVNIFGSCVNGTAQLNVPLPNFSSTYSVFLGNVSSTDFYYQFGSGFNAITDFVVTIQYTKTV